MGVFGSAKIIHELSSFDFSILKIFPKRYNPFPLIQTCRVTPIRVPEILLTIPHLVVKLKGTQLIPSHLVITIVLLYENKKKIQTR